MLKKGSKFKRALSLILATAMVSQNCMITSIGGDTVSTESAQIETQAAEAAAQAEAERQAAEAAARAEAERQAAEAAAQAEAERQAAEAAAQAEAERQAAEAAAKAESERQAAEEAAKAESERQAAEEAAKEEQQTPQTEGQTESQPAATEKQTEEQKEPAKDEDKKEPEKDNDKPAKDEDKKEPAETEKKEVFYRVTFDSHAADQGKIQVKDEANPVTVDTVSTYYKEVKEKDAFTFTVVPNEDYEVEYVRADQIDIPKTEKENEYKIANVTKDTVITVTYKELPKDTEPAEDADAEEGQDTEEDGHVRNTVTFEAGVGVTVLSDGADVTNGTGQAVDGTILFTVTPTNGYEVTSVLVDGSIEARTTENANEYVIENIQTDDTIVSITTEWVGVEETETETEVETETETEIEIETETETEVETETETELESESETEVLMPAQEFTQTAGSTVVTVSAPEGAFPEGTTMKAVPVSADTVVAAVEDQVAAEGKEIVDVVAVDITFYDKDGKEIQPAADVAVSFGNVPVSEAAEEAAVYHIDDAANAEVVAEVAPEDTEATFQAESFSVYAYTRIASLNQEAEIMPLVNELNTVGTIEVKLVDTEGNSIGEGTVTINLGTVADNVPSVSGYEYQYAKTSAGTMLDLIGRYGEQYYYATAAGSDDLYQAATYLGEDEAIQLVYQAVGYKIDLNITGANNEADNTVDCPNYANLDGSFSLEVSTDRKYEATVSVEGQEQTASSVDGNKSTYSVNGATAGTDDVIHVTVSYEEIKTREYWAWDTTAANWHHPNWPQDGNYIQERKYLLQERNSALIYRHQQKVMEQ